jgi:hypothetical protein
MIVTCRLLGSTTSPSSRARPWRYSRKVRQRSTATLMAGTDLIRPTQAYDLHQRPSLTALQLVHTAQVVSSSVFPALPDGLLSPPQD